MNQLDGSEPCYVVGLVVQAVKKTLVFRLTLNEPWESMERKSGLSEFHFYTDKPHTEKARYANSEICSSSFQTKQLPLSQLNKFAATRKGYRNWQNFELEMFYNV